MTEKIETKVMKFIIKNKIPLSNGLERFSKCQEELNFNKKGQMTGTILNQIGKNNQAYENFIKYYKSLNPNYQNP